MGRVRTAHVELVLRVRLQARPGEERLPAVILAAIGIARRIRDVDRARVRRIAFEVERVDDCALDRPLGRELDDDPVRPLAAGALGLPAVTHVHAAARHDEIMTRAEELVITSNDEPSVLRSGEVDELGARELSRPASAGHDVTVDAQACDAAIWVNVESQMGETLRDVDGEEVLAVALQVHARKDRRPLNFIGGELRDVGVAVDARALDRARFRVIAFEERRVDDEPADDAREAEPDDRGVVIGIEARGFGILPLAARLPSRPSICRDRCICHR